MRNKNSDNKVVPKSKIVKLSIYVLLLSILFFLLSLLIFNCYVGSYAKDRLYYNINQVPHRKAALVLGCAKYVEGRPNLYYKFRLDAVQELWSADKINAVIVSGDNSRKDYDEPTAMKADLVERGIPTEYITIDYAGFRTLDSIYRAEHIFDLDDYIIVSQSFHCSRAIFLASKKGQSVIGYCARDISGKVGVKVRFREVLARVKAVIDVVTSKSPKFLGEKETVRYRNIENND